MSRTVIAGGSVVDGTGAPGRPMDVFLRDERIDDVRPASDQHAGWDVVDASGLTVTPGFIDAHSHADCAPLLPAPDTTKVLQGVTTEIVGNCGFSLAPSVPERRDVLGQMLAGAIAQLDGVGTTFAELLAQTDRAGYVTNYAPLVGHGTLRVAAMGMDAREPTTLEMRTMEAMLEEGLDAGAFGVSTGLIYAPGVFSATEELVTLARRLRANMLYCSHIRGEGAALLDAVAEALEIGERARVRVQISHHKAAGRSNWGRTKASLAMIAQARARGVDVHQDVYPYLAGSTFLHAVLPPDFHAGGPDETLRRLRNPDAVRSLEARFRDGATGFENFVHEAGYDGILISSTASHKNEGLTLAEIAERDGISAFEALLHVLRSERLVASMVVFLMDDEDVERVLLDDDTVIGSDGAAPGMAGKHHPRLYGTFPRVISHYVRERRVLSIEAAVRKMTSLPAAIFRLPERGSIAPGNIADVVAFDADDVADDLDYRDPARPPKGLAWVMIGGVRVVEGQRYIGERRGRRLRPLA